MKDIAVLEDFIGKIDKKLKEKRKALGQSDIEGTYARSLKLSEEVGELNAEILAFFGDQRIDKLGASSKQKLEEEFADVIITTLLLARSFDIDISKCLKEKMLKIKQRWGIEE